MAAQSLLEAFQLFAANIRKINALLTKNASSEKKFREAQVRRKTKSLASWAPAPCLSG